MPSSYDALLCIAFGIAPGYLFYSTLGAVTVREGRNSTALIIESVAGSTVFWVVVGPLVYWLVALDLISQNAGYVIAGVLALLLPIGLGILWGIQERSGEIRNFLQLRNPTPTSWDYRFGLNESLWVLVTFHDGSRVGGIWGSNSFASSYPNEPDLYIETVFELNENGGFLEPKQRSAGILIFGSSIKCLELFSTEEPK